MPADRRGSSALSGLFAGVELIAFVDETVFHQLLHWHPFYDKATPEWGLVDLDAQPVAAP
ncbi:MAG TPA: DUF2243 domain-containing protein [Microlunatus sp.]